MQERKLESCILIVKLYICTVFRVYVFISTGAVVFAQEFAELLSETREPIDTAISNCEKNSDKSPPNGLLSEADCCPKTEYSDSDRSPLRTRVRLPF